MRTEISHKLVGFLHLQLTTITPYGITGNKTYHDYTKESAETEPMVN